MTIIDTLFEKGILVSPDVLEDPLLIARLSRIDPDELDDKVAVIDRRFIDNYEKVNQISVQPESARSDFKVTFSYNKKPGKISVNDFVSYFNRRFEGLSSFMKQRLEFQRLVSINRLKAKTEKENISVLGLVWEKSVTKKNNIILTLEDPTGTINVLVKQDKKELYNMAKEVMLDELIGVEGSISEGFIFANQIFVPEIPMVKELKKSPEEEYVVCIGDPHFGSKVFLKEEFEDFIEWINGNKGNDEQKQISSKIRYLLIVGDLVEGVGVYPGQEKDLSLNDIKSQYDEFSAYLKRIPERIQIFICPGNHDAGRISEPQPPIQHAYAGVLQKLPNVTLVSSPAIVTLGVKHGFPGFDFLMYHGYSLIYYADHVDSIRSKGGQKRPDLIMKFLLQKRHLSPTHTSNLYIPDNQEDPMIIKTIPDFFITGHIHRVSVNNYKNITLVNCSCWTAVTEDQEKRGLQPQPAKVPIINLKTRDVRVINFLKPEHDRKEGAGEATQDKKDEVVAVAP